MQFIIQFDEDNQFILHLEEHDPKTVSADTMIYDRYGDGKEQYELYLFRVVGDESHLESFKDLPEDIKEWIGEELNRLLPVFFVANPYFDEVIILYDHTVHTSQDKFKPVTCDQCGRFNLFEARDKANKANYIEQVHQLLRSNPNPDWPFKGDLLVQYSISDRPSRLKEVDIDNIAKTLFDSLVSFAYEDDGQIRAFAGDKQSVLNIGAVIIAIKRIGGNEKPMFQEFLFSGNKSQWKSEYDKKLARGEATRFVTFKDIGIEQKAGQP